VLFQGQIQAIIALFSHKIAVFAVFVTRHQFCFTPSLSLQIWPSAARWGQTKQIIIARDFFSWPIFCPVYFCLSPSSASDHW
jgi:hypothetical protein